MKINNKASLIAKKEIEIDAPISHVWKIQTDIEKWPDWQSDVSEASLNGELKKGTTFFWKAMGMNIRSSLQKVEANSVIGWTGDSFGMHAVHYWYFEKKGNKTLVTSEESLSGWFPKIIKLFKPQFLEDALAKSLLTLKIHAEKTK